MKPALNRIQHLLAAASLLLALALCTGSAFAAGADRPTARDIAGLTRAGSMDLSPDGTMIALDMTTYTYDSTADYSPGDKLAGWSRDTQVYLLPREGGDLRQLTRGDAGARAPKWSPDGSRIAFRRTVDGSSRILILPLDGGEARVLDTGKLEPGEFEWSPDGSHIAFIAELPMTHEEKVERWKTGGTVHYGEEYRPNNLYVIPVDGGEALQIDPGLWNVVSFRWAPTGDRFAVLTSRTSDPYEVSSLLTPRIISAVDGHEIAVADTTVRGIEGLGWSPDGRYLAWTAGVNTLSLMNALMVYDTGNDTLWNAAADLDITLSGFAWAPDGSIYAHLLRKTRSQICHFIVGEGRFQFLGLLDRAYYGDFEIDPTGRYILDFSSTPYSPPDPTLYDLKFGRSEVVTALNPVTESWPHGEIKVVDWVNAEGVTIEGILMLPPTTAQDTLPPPLMVQPHGGPDSVSRESWYRWGVYFNARGYAVFRPNYRGGFGYGRDFYAANRGRFGELEQMDIESGVDSLITWGMVDSSRMVFTGWSWGGYITDWMLAHTHRYKAMVSGASVFDPTLGYALSDINHGVAAEWEYKGNPWLQRENFDRAAPIRFIENASTPTLILHGEQDDRVPFAQSIMLYRALKDLGVPCEFYAYPREPHGPREPAHTTDYLTRWGDWCDRWISTK